MTKLTNREKNLLFALSLVVIILLGVQFLFLPQFKSNNEKKTEYANLSTKKSEVEMRVASEASIRQNYDNAKQEYDQIKTRYPVKVDNETIDNMTTGVTLKNRLAPMQLAIMDLQQVPLAAISPEKAKEEKEKAVTENEKEMSVFYLSNASMNATGTYESLKWLINEVAGMSNMRISRVNIQSGNDGGTVTIGPQRMLIVFRISMLEEH